MKARIALLVGLSAGYLLALYAFFRPVQLRVWNSFSALDVLVMAGLILPFVVVHVFVPPRHRVTHFAWGVCAVMALDVVFFALAEFAPPGSGHPSLESLASFFMAMAKPVLVPVALALLGIACVKGERMAVVALGFLCVAGESLYGTYPTA